MNILVTTLGTSWQIVLELFGFTNPNDFDFFSQNQQAQKVRSDNNIKPVDEIWIITTEGFCDKEKLCDWAKKYPLKLKFIICKNVKNFSNENEIKKMRSLIYRSVFNAKSLCKKSNGKFYISLAGGRKTMSADMQEAANIFGCDAMLHIVDIQDFSAKTKNNSSGDCNNNEGKKFLPIVIATNIPESLVISADESPLSVKKYSLSKTEIQEEDLSLLFEIEKRKRNSQRLYANFYSNFTKKQNSKRESFRKLYFLSPQILQKLQDFKIIENQEKAQKIIKQFPKAELHSHLGGVLTPEDILQVAIKVQQNKEKLNEKTKYVLNFVENPEEFKNELYKDFYTEDKFYKIGIDPYQKLGSYQGSDILQNKTAIKETIRIYAKSLKENNVQYAEIRCSPYKYTKSGLTEKQVIDYIIESMEENAPEIQFKIICIVGRQAAKEEIKDSVQKILNLLEQSENFKKVFAGIDLAGNEANGKPEELREIFMPFLEKCYHITIHAGETQDANSIWQAIYHLSAERVGHGLKLFERPELLNHFANRNIGIEMCPSSNDQIVGFSRENNKEYPLKKYLEEGLRVTINTDDQGISRTNLTNEFIKAAKLCPKLTLWDVLILIRNSLSIAFIDTKTKRNLMQKFENEIMEIIEKEFN